jgi:hypothetical protein
LYSDESLAGSPGFQYVCVCVVIRWCFQSKALISSGKKLGSELGGKPQRTCKRESCEPFTVLFIDAGRKKSAEISV